MTGDRSQLQTIGCRMTFLVGRDLMVVSKCQRHVVEPLEKTFLRERIDMEVRRPSEFVRDRLCPKVDGQFVSVMLLDSCENGVDFFGRENNRQEAVLERVVAKDVGEGGRNRRLETEVSERPHRVLARTAASEVVSRDQDRRALKARLG